MGVREKTASSGAFQRDRARVQETTGRLPVSSDLSAFEPTFPGDPPHHRTLGFRRQASRKRAQRGAGSSDGAGGRI